MAITRVSPTEAKKLIDQQGYLYIDVRSEPEYAAGHPVGALNVPVQHAGWGGMQPNPEFLNVIQTVYPRKETKIIVGCKSGQRSALAAEMLVDAGYIDVVDQRAGYEGTKNSFGSILEPGWVTQGLPTETVTPGASYAELKKKAGWR
jgi:rhodanese-related sulfurtransferase